jgi:hypothetical protein
MISQWRWILGIRHVITLLLQARLREIQYHQISLTMLDRANPLVVVTNLARMNHRVLDAQMMATETERENASALQMEIRIGGDLLVSITNMTLGCMVCAIGDT